MSEYEEIHGGFLLFKCPYDNCYVKIIVHRAEVNCGIFRCNPHLAPHASPEECEAHKNHGLGCCRPIQFRDNKFHKCEYI